MKWFSFFGYGGVCIVHYFEQGMRMRDVRVRVLIFAAVMPAENIDINVKANNKISI